MAYLSKNYFVKYCGSVTPRNAQSNIHADWIKVVHRQRKHFKLCTIFVGPKILNIFSVWIYKSEEVEQSDYSKVWIDKDEFWWLAGQKLLVKIIIVFLI